MDRYELLAKKICPRCGQPFKWLERKKIGNNVYYYAVHEKKIGNKRQTKRCYLGPESYIYVTHTHLPKEGLQLRGLIDTNRVLEYLEAIIAYVRQTSIDPSTARALAIRFRKLAEALEEIARRGRDNEEERNG